MQALLTKVIFVFSQFFDTREGGVALSVGRSKLMLFCILSSSNGVFAFFRTSRMPPKRSPKRRRVDTRREPDPPKSYEVEKLVEFRERKLRSRGKEIKSVLECKVRWAGE